MSEANITGQSRNTAIDFVRAICVLLIVLAHVSIPEYLLNIRCFDVVCLVFLSGMSYELSTRKKQEGYFHYLWRRIKKLLIPTYIVLTVIFATVFIVNGSSEPIGLIKMIESYLLYDGIGYVWFVRVTLMLATVSPFLLIAQNKLSRMQQIIIFLTLVVVYIGLISVYKSNILSYWPNLFLYLYPIFLLGYGIVYAFGMQYYKLDRKTKVGVFCLFFICCIIAYLCGVKNVSADKYPPGILYLSWGGVWAIVLYELFTKINIKKVPWMFSFLSKNSFDIYLYHIIPLLILKYITNSFVKFVNQNWIIQYMFVLGIAFTITLIKNIICDLARKNRRREIAQ